MIDPGAKWLARGGGDADGLSGLPTVGETVTSSDGLIATARFYLRV
jgi:hypothetical protein